MKSSLRPLKLVLLLSAVALQALGQQPVGPRQRTGFDAIHESDLRANLAFIAGDGLLGRMSLQPGDDAAAEWVAAEFAKAGLQPAAKDASGKPSYLQPVPLVEYKPDSSATLLAETHPDGTRQQWTSGDISSSYRENVDVHGGLVFAGSASPRQSLDTTTTPGSTRAAR